MAPKKKLNQISNYDENSNILFKSNSNERKKLKNKRIKKTDTTEDPKVVLESNQKIFQLPSRGLKNVINMCLIIVKLTTLKKK